MKKKTTWILIVCLAACLCGCQKDQRQLCRYVTQVDIFCDHDGLPIHRRYTDTEKMEAALLHIRLLNPGGPPLTDPEALEADLYEIRVSLSDGQTHVYRQKDHRYFRMQNNGWQTIPPEQAARLYDLMRHYQSDL